MSGAGAGWVVGQAGSAGWPKALRGPSSNSLILKVELISYNPYGSLNRVH